MTSPSLPAPAATRMSVAAQHRTMRWILLGIVALAAFLVAVVGRPPVEPVGIPGPGPGLVGVSHQGPIGPSSLHG